MREVRIKSAKLTSFRGQTFEVEFKPGRTDIAGFNGTGKTTLFAAVKWCFTGVDEMNRTNYDLFDSTLPYAPENAVWSVVESVVDSDGVPYVFRRQARPKWVRPRGSSEYKKDSSDEYKFFVDDLELSAGSYRDKVLETFGMEMEKLKLAMDIRYYQMLEWRDLRKHFADLVGDINKADFKGDYSSVEAFLEKYKGGEKAKEYLRQQIAPLKEQVSNVEADIKAAKRGLPDLAPVDEALRSIKEKKKRIEEINREILGLEEANKPFVEKRDKELCEIRAMKQRYNAAEDEYDAKVRASMTVLEAELDKAKMHNAEIERSARRNEQLIASRKAEIRMCREDIEDLEQEITNLRAQNKELKSREFSDTLCPSCGQELPAGMIAELKSKFYEDIEKLRAPVVERGRKIAERLEAQKARLAKLESEEVIVTDSSGCLIDADAIRRKIDEAKAQNVPFCQTEESRLMTAEIEERQSALTVVPEVDSAELQDESRALVQDIQDLSIIAARRELHASMLADIEKYEEDKRRAGAELAKWEGLLAKLIEREREWAETVRSRANGFLEHSHVEMLEPSKSGGLVDTCTLTINSVDRRSTNHANKTIIGLDISNALCKRYGVSLPVFIDDFEHFTKQLPDTHGRQVITLSADKHYEKLTAL